MRKAAAEEVTAAAEQRKDLKDFDWSYNPKLPKCELLELATLKFHRRA